MSTARTIAKNTTVLFIAQMITYVMSFFITMYTARYLGTAGFGTLQLALSITGITVIFADLGLGTLMVREIARDKSLTDTYVSNVALMKFLLFFLTVGITILIVYIFKYPEPASTVIYIITLAILINSFNGVLSAIFQANEKMEYISINTIFNSTLMLIGTAIGIYYGFNIFFFAFIYVISNLFSFFYILAVYLKMFSLPKLEIDFSFWKPTIKEAWAFGVSGIFISIYFYIASIVLSVVAGESAVGIYNAARNLIFVFLFIPNVVIISLFPVMSRHFKSSKDLLKLEYEKALKYLYVIAIFILIYGFIFADNIILLIYNSGFSGAIIALQVLIFVVPVIFITSLFGNLLGAINRQRFVTIVAGINAIVNVALNLLLIPQFGYVGAGIATVITESIGFILMFTYISKYFLKISITQNLLKTTFGGLLVALLIYYLKVDVNWILAGIVGVFAYMAVIIILKIITREDIELFKNFIK